MRPAFQLSGTPNWTEVAGGDSHLHTHTRGANAVNELQGAQREKVCAAGRTLWGKRGHSEQRSGRCRSVGCMDLNRACIETGAAARTAGL